MRIDKIDNNNILEYAKLKAEENRIKERLSELSPEVTSWVEEVIGIDSTDKTLELPNGDKLTLVVGRNWEYPQYIKDEVDSLKKKVTEIQKIYQIKNPNKWNPSTSVRFKEGGESK